METLDDIIKRVEGEQALNKYTNNGNDFWDTLSKNADERQKVELEEQQRLANRGFIPMAKRVGEIAYQVPGNLWEAGKQFVKDTYEGGKQELGLVKQGEYNPIESIGATGYGALQGGANLLEGAWNLPGDIRNLYEGQELTKPTHPLTQGMPNLVNKTQLGRNLSDYQAYLQEKYPLATTLSQELGEEIPGALLGAGVASKIGKAGKLGKLNKPTSIKDISYGDLAKGSVIGGLGEGMLIDPSSDGTYLTPEQRWLNRFTNAGTGAVIAPTLNIGTKATLQGIDYASPYIQQGINNTAQATQNIYNNVVSPAKAVADEIVNRLNPNNYETIIEATPVETGVGLSQHTEYVPQVKRVYRNPNVVANETIDINAQPITPQTQVNQPLLTNTPLLTDNGTGFVLGESGNLVQNIAPNIYKKQQSKATSKPIMALPDNLGISNKVQETVSKIAPKTVEKQAQEKQEEVQNKEFRKINDEHTAELMNVYNKYSQQDIQKGKHLQEVDAINRKYEPLEQKAIKKQAKRQKKEKIDDSLREEAEAIVFTAIKKSYPHFSNKQVRNYLTRVLKSNQKTIQGQRKSEEIYNKITDKLDDKLADLEGSNLVNFPELSYNNNRDVDYYQVMEKALNILKGERPVDIFEEREKQFVEYIDKTINEINKKLQNAKSIDEFFEIYDNIANELPDGKPLYYDFEYALNTILPNVEKRLENEQRRTQEEINKTEKRQSSNDIRGVEENSNRNIEQVDKKTKSEKLVEKLAPNIAKKQELKERIDKAKKQIKDNIFIPDEQKQVLIELLEGDEKEHFIKVAQELEDTINNAPNMYETEETSNVEDKKPILHYFVGSYDNYVFEIDKETGELFGAVSFNGEDFELGYSSMEELNSLKSHFAGNNIFVPSVELDLYYDNTQTFGDITGVKTTENGNNINKEDTENETRQEPTRSELGNNSIDNKRREGTRQESDERVQREQSDNGSNDVGERFENVTLIPEHKTLIEQKYKNAHELNLAIEKFIKDKEYEKYDVLPEEVKEWLKKYTGAGGKEKQGAKGRGLLSEYYTPKNIVKKMWDLTSQYIDTDGAKVLEPSVGIGRFLELAPENIDFDVIEMNPISAKITELLYPQANVTVGQFEQKFIKNNAPVKSVTPEYDIVIGNPPYGKYSGQYKGMGEGKGIDRYETYFIKRGLDTLKENGIMTFIVQDTFLKSAMTPAKFEIGQNAELLDAYRLPNNSFDETSTGTDIIVLRKTKTKSSDKNIASNKWFEKHPEKILGEVQTGKGNWGNDIVKGDKSAVESIDTSKKDIKETKKTVEQTQKSEIAKTTSKTTKKKTETKKIKESVEYNEYKPLLTVPEEEKQYFIDTKVDGTLPKDKYSPNEKVNQYNGELYNDFNYLQGDIYEKLDALQREKISDKQKEIQRKKLESVLPTPKIVKEISFNPTSDFVKDFIVGEDTHWNYITRKDEKIPRTIVSDFQRYLRTLGKEERENVSVKEIVSYTNGEAVRFDYDYPPGMYDKKEKEKYAKQQRPKLLAKLKRVSERLFNNYISEKLDVEYQEQLAEKWNKAYNNLYTPDYYKMPLLVKGLRDTFYGEKLQLNKLQEKGINFLTNKGIGLLGFEVGTGKTLAGIISTVQNMQMGRCKRPLILVPKQVKDNWIKEIGETFPNITVNDVGNLSDFKGEIENNTVTVATYEALSNIWYEPRLVEQMKDDLFDVSRRTLKENEKRTARKIETDIQKAEELIGKAQKNNKERYRLSELGFDHVTVDEAHNFKNLFNKAETEGKEEGTSKGNSYSGIQVQGGDSQRASRLFLLVQQILKNNGNRNVFMLTATPFSNNPLEVFNMLSYLSKDSLDKVGLYNAYQFMETYADTDADWAVTVSNDVVMKNQVKGFKNGSSLRSIIKNVILMGSADEVGIKRPEKYTTSIQLEPSRKQLELIREAEEELMENKTENGAIFKALHKSRMATLSPDIAKGNINVSPEEFIKNSPKLQYIMEAVESMKKKDPNTSQLIYMPMGVDYLPKIKKYLIDKGVFKANEIELITSEVKDDKIPDITDSFNDRNGKVKLIIGTQKIKEGMNLNKNSSVLYIPQLDWNPTDFVQVVGRIWRQGNRYNKVRVVVPLLKNSSDPFMYQKLSEKTSRLNDLMSDEAGDYIDSGELNTEEERLNMITLPDKKAKMFTVVETEKINGEISELKGKLDTVNRIKDELTNAKELLEYNQKEYNRYKELIKEVDKEKEKDRYEALKGYQDNAKKNLAKYKGQVERLDKTIKDREFDFEGKDKPENIEAEIKKLEERKENLKEIELQKLEEYTKEYNKNQVLSKSIAEQIKEFDKQTDELYGGVYPKTIGHQDYVFSELLNNLKQEETPTAFFLQGKDIVYDGRKVSTIGEIMQHPQYKPVRDFFDKKHSNVEIRLIDPAHGSDNDAYFLPEENAIYVSANVTPEIIVHEYTHFLDFYYNGDTELYEMELLLYNTEGKSFKELRKDFFEGIAIYNEFIAKRRMKGDKNAKFRRPTNKITTLLQKYAKGEYKGRSLFSTIRLLGRKKKTSTSGTRKIKQTSSVFTHRGIQEEEIDYSKYNKVAKNYIREWYSDIEKDRYDVNKTLNSFINMTKAIAKEYSKKFGMKINDKQVREILPFLRERTELPERLERPDLKQFFNKLSGQDKARLTKLADDTSSKFEKYYKEYQEANGIEDIESIENHISHIWDLDKKQQSLLTNYFATSSRFAKNRTIDTLVKGIDGFEVNGETIYFKPKTLDYAEILKTSSDSFIKAKSDMILANRVKNIGTKKNPLVLPTHKAPSDWVEFNHPALNKSVYMGGNADVSIIGKRPVKVHPDIAKTLKTVFETPATRNEFIVAFDKANSIYKQSQLGFSGFHMVALSESMLGNIGVKETLKLLNPTRMYNEIAKGNWGIYKDDTISKQAIEDGLQLGATLDLDRGTVERIADDVTSFVEKIPVVGKYFKYIPQTLGKAQRLNNKILWDYLHNNYKLECYKLYVTQEAERLGRALTKSERREITQWVNDSFGGQVWENLGISSSQRRIEQRFLLSPDWLRSTTRQFLGMLSNQTVHKFVTEKAKENEFWKGAKELGEEWGLASNTDDVTSSTLRGRLARAFWLRALIYSAILYNVMNAFFRERDKKEHPEYYPKNMTIKDYSLLGNSKGSESYVFIGRNSDGTERYLRLGKQFREMPEMVEKPIEKLGGKASPMLQIGSQIFTGHTVGGFKNRNFYGNTYSTKDKIKGGWERVGESAKLVGTSLAPYSLNDVFNPYKDVTAWSLFAPVGKGMTKSKGQSAFVKAIKDGNKEDFKDIRQSLIRNGFDKKDIKKIESSSVSEFIKPYKDRYAEALEKNDKKEVAKIKKELSNSALSETKIKEIFNKEYEKFYKNRK